MAKDISHGQKALATPILKPMKFPTVLRFIFACKRCDTAFPIESGFVVRTVISIEDARQVLAEFAKTVEPRTITC
jgi:hypothetical protein